MPPKQEIAAAFATHFGALPSLVVHSPGRVNLIGEHTDYNEGWVFPAALDLGTLVAARPRSDGRLRTVALRLNETDEAALDDLRPADGPSWTRYVRGMVLLLVGAGCALSGADLLIGGNLPLTGGLSSSASLELGVGVALTAMAGCSIGRRDLALLAQRAEHEYVGVRCGIMDQLAVAFGVANHALLIDCRTLQIEPVPLPAQVRLLIMDSNVPRTLAGSAYNLRRAECEKAVRCLQRAYPHVRALRDVTPDMLEAHADCLGPLVLRRARHVVHENQRVLDGARALRRGDVAAFGKLMVASHASLRDDYEVSGPELDTLVELARSTPGVLGARLTGAGFGGSVIALVEAGQAEAAAASIMPLYRKASGREGATYICAPAPGARVLD